MKTLLIYFLVLILVFSSFFAYAQEYRLGPDDVLDINVYREEELNRRVRISSDGYFTFPFLRKVKAEGLTVSELERNLKKALRKYLKNPQVTVFVIEYGTITVTGQVEKPGSFPLKGELTVIEAISLAGGFTKIAAKNSVRIMRVENGKEKSILVEVEEISKKGNKLKDVPLKRGDIIYVPESFF